MLTTNRFSSRQAYGTCLCPRKDEVHPRALQALDRVAGVVDDVPLAAGAGHRAAGGGGGRRSRSSAGSANCCLDPAVAAAPDLAVVEVGLGRVDGDDADPALAQHRVPAAEELLEVDVADVSRVVVPGDDDERLAGDPVEVALRLRVLLLEAERREVAGADDDVRARAR